MSLLDAAVLLLCDTAHRRGTSVREDIVRRELGAVDFSRGELVEYLTSDNVYKLLTISCADHVDIVWAEVRHVADAFIPKPVAAAASANEDLFAPVLDAGPRQHVASGLAATASLAYDLEAMSGGERATALQFTSTAAERARRDALLSAAFLAAPVPPASSEALLTFAAAVAAMRGRSSQPNPGAASSAGVAGKGAPPPPYAGTGAPPPPDASVPPPDAGMDAPPAPRDVHMAGMAGMRRSEQEELDLADMLEALDWVSHEPRAEPFAICLDPHNIMTCPARFGSSLRATATLSSTCCRGAF